MVLSGDGLTRGSVFWYRHCHLIIIESLHSPVTVIIDSASSVGVRRSTLILHRPDMSGASFGGVRLAWNKWREVTGVICDKEVPVKLKHKIDKTVIKPIIGLYAEQ